MCENKFSAFTTIIHLDIVQASFPNRLLVLFHTVQLRHGSMGRLVILPYIWERVSSKRLWTLKGSNFSLPPKMAIKNKILLLLWENNLFPPPHLSHKTTKLYRLKKKHVILQTCNLSTASRKARGSLEVEQSALRNPVDIIPDYISHKCHIYNKHKK